MNSNTRHSLSRRTVLRSGVTASLLLGVGLPATTGSAAAMNKAELIEAMASESGLSKADAKRALDGIIGSTTEALVNGSSVTVVDFGLFDVSTRATEGRDNGADDAPVVGFEPCPKFAAALDLTPGSGDERRNASSYRCRSGDVVIDAERIARESRTGRGSESSLSKVDAKRALDALVDAAAKALKKGDTVTMVGFGSFSISKRSARTGRNPQRGKESPGKKTVKFKAGAELSKAVN